VAQSATLEALIDAVASAVIGAQDKIEIYQAGLLAQYLDPDRRPRTIDIRVPSNRSNAGPNDEATLSVPVLAVVGATRLAIESMEVSMDVDLGDLQQAITNPEGDEPTDSNESSAPARHTVMVDMASPRATSRDALGKVVLKVSAKEPTEGLQRLLMELNKRIGVIEDSAAG